MQARRIKAPTTVLSIYRLLAATLRHPASLHGMRITSSLTTAVRLPLQSVLLQPTLAALCPLGSSQILHAFRRQVVSTWLSHLGWPHHLWAFLYTSGSATQKSRGRYSGYCRRTGMAQEWVSGTHRQSASDSGTAIHASSSQCRLLLFEGGGIAVDISKFGEGYRSLQYHERTRLYLIITIKRYSARIVGLRHR